MRIAAITLLAIGVGIIILVSHIESQIVSVFPQQTSQLNNLTPQCGGCAADVDVALLTSTPADNCGFCHEPEADPVLQARIDDLGRRMMFFAAQHQPLYKNDARYQTAQNAYQQLQQALISDDGSSVSPSSVTVQEAITMLSAALSQLEARVASGVITLPEQPTTNSIVLASGGTNVNPAIARQPVLINMLPDSSVTILRWVIVFVVPLCIVFAIHRRGPPEDHLFNSLCLGFTGGCRHWDVQSPFFVSVGVQPDLGCTS
jgi:hypothetical protein